MHRSIERVPIVSVKLTPKRSPKTFLGFSMNNYTSGTTLSHSSKVGQIKVTDDMLSQAARLIKTEENDVYENLGLSFTLWENLQGVDLVFREPEGIVMRPPSTEIGTMRLYRAKRKLTAYPIVGLREDLIKKGKKYFQKNRRKLFQKICVEKEACKWSKEILGDSKALLLELIPLVSIVLGIAVPVIVVTVAILIAKWTIIKFCKCSNP